MEKFNLTCRACNTERSNLVNLLINAPGSDSLNLLDLLITVCPSLSIHLDDGLPQQICYFCSKQLEIAYKFQLQCKKSHDDLWKILAAGIKEEPCQNIPPLSPPNVKSEGGEGLLVQEDIHDGECDDSRSYVEDEFEYGSTGITENLEFLDEDDDMNDVDKDPAAYLPETEENPQQLTNVEPDPPVQNEEPPIMCCNCGKKFLTVNGLRLHEKLAHKNLKPMLIEAEILTIECKFCLQVFEKKSELLMHQRMEHKNELRSEFTCDTCHKTFSQKNKLDRHLLYHSKNRFQCEVKDCKRLFVIKYKLADHLKRFHGISLTTNKLKVLKPYAKEEL